MYHVHCKESVKQLDGRNGRLSSHLPWGDPRRGWDFVTAGHGDVPWERVFRVLNHIGYAGPTSVEWEDAGMDRLVGGPEALAFVRQLGTIAPPDAAFDAAFSQVALTGRRVPDRTHHRSPCGAPRRNTARVLRLVHEDGPVTRAELTRRTGLNRSTILALVGELVDAGLVHEETPRRGDPPVPVSDARAESSGRRPTSSPPRSRSRSTPSGSRSSASTAPCATGWSSRRPPCPPRRRPSTPWHAVLAATPARTGPAARIVGVGVAVPGIVRVEDGRCATPRTSDGVTSPSPNRSPPHWGCRSGSRTTPTSVPGRSSCTAAAAASTTSST